MASATVFKWKFKLKFFFLLVELENWIKFRELLNLASATVTNGGSRGKSEVENQSRFSRNSPPPSSFLSLLFCNFQYTPIFLWHLQFLGNSTHSHPRNIFLSFFLYVQFSKSVHSIIISFFLVKNVICLEMLFLFPSTGWYCVFWWKAFQ